MFSVKQCVQSVPSCNGSLLLGAPFSGLPCPCRRGSRGDREVSSGSFYFFWSLSHSDPQPPPSTTLILWFPMTRLCPTLGWSPSFPGLCEVATPHVCLVSGLLHMCLSAPLTPAVLLTVLSAEVCFTSCPQTHCLSQVLTSQEALPSMSPGEPMLPSGCPCDVFYIYTDTVRCLLWWRNGVTGDWARSTAVSILIDLGSCTLDQLTSADAESTEVDLFQGSWFWWC